MPNSPENLHDLTASAMFLENKVDFTNFTGESADALMRATGIDLSDEQRKALIEAIEAEKIKDKDDPTVRIRSMEARRFQKSDKKQVEAFKKVKVKEGNDLVGGFSEDSYLAVAKIVVGSLEASLSRGGRVDIAAIAEYVAAGLEAGGADDEALKNALGMSRQEMINFIDPLKRQEDSISGTKSFYGPMRKMFVERYGVLPKLHGAPDFFEDSQPGSMEGVEDLKTSEEFSKEEKLNEGEKNESGSFNVSKQGFVKEYENSKMLESVSKENKLYADQVSKWVMKVAAVCAADHGSNLQSLAQFEPQAFGNEGAQASTVVATLNNAVYSLQQYYDTIHKGTDEVVDDLTRVAPQTIELQSVISALSYPFGFEIENKPTEVVELSAGDVLGIFEGEGIVELKYGENGELMIKRFDGKGKEFSIEGMSADDIKRKVLWNDQLSVAYEENYGVEEFGRRKSGELIMTMTENLSVESELGPIVSVILRKLEKQGVTPEMLTGVLTTDAEGNPINIDNEKIKMFSDEVEGDREAVGVEMLIEALVTFIRIKISGKQLGEVINVNWDPSRVKDRMSQSFLKIYNKVDYDEYYQINPGHARVMATAFLNTLTAWKRNEVDMLAISMNGNKDFARLVSQNPVRPVEDAPLIPPLLTTITSDDHPEGIPFWKLEKSDGKLLNNSLPEEYKIFFLGEGDKKIIANDKEVCKIIRNTVDAIRFERMPWRSNTHDSMEFSNLVVDRLEKSADMGENYKKSMFKGLENRARTLFDSYVSSYGDLAPQEWRRNQPNRHTTTDSLLQQKRVALSFIDLKPLVQAAGGEVGEAMDEEFTGWLGMHRFNQVDKAKQIIIGNMEQYQKYASTYPAMAKATTKGIEKMFVAMNNSIDYVAQSLMGEMPDVMSALGADSAGEALIKGVINAGFAMMGARKQGDVFKFVDEAADVFVNEVLTLTSPRGEYATEDAIDLIIFMNSLRDEALEAAVVFYSKGKEAKSSKHLQSTDMLTLGKLSDADKSKAQRLIELRGHGVFYPMGSDPKDGKYLNLASGSQKHLSVSMAEGSDVYEKAKQRGFSMRAPIVRDGINTIRRIRIHESEDRYSAMSNQRVRGNYGHKGSEKLWLLWTINKAKDMMKLDNKSEVEVYKRLGVTKKEVENAMKDYEEKVKNNYTKAILDVQRYKKEIDAEEKKRLEEEKE